MTEYIYDYHREKITYISGQLSYNVNFLERYNQYGEITKLYQEVSKVFPNTTYKLLMNVDGDETLVRFIFFYELSTEEEQKLNTVFTNHSTDVADKWGIYYPSTQTFEMATDGVRRFDTQEEAQQYINDNLLEDCVTKAIVEM